MCLQKSYFKPSSRTSWQSFRGYYTKSLHIHSSSSIVFSPLHTELLKSTKRFMHHCVGEKSFHDLLEGAITNISQPLNEVLFIGIRNCNEILFPCIREARINSKKNWIMCLEKIILQLPLDCLNKLFRIPQTNWNSILSQFGVFTFAGFAVWMEYTFGTIASYCILSS